jgi:hypothetical protein
MTDDDRVGAQDPLLHEQSKPLGDNDGNAHAINPHSTAQDHI